MRKWMLLPLLAAWGLGLQACAPKSQNDCGFVQNVYGERISWKGQVPVVMHLHSSVPASYETAIRDAARTWNSRAGKTLIEISSRRVSGVPDGRDRMNVISFASSWDPSKLAEQAKTTVHWVGDQIQEADVKVNASKVDGESVFSFYYDQAPTEPSVNMEALTLHEFGHVIGLKHDDKGKSVMATYLANNSDRTQLSSSDEANLQCEY